jgi:hypothetical protein
MTVMNYGIVQSELPWGDTSAATAADLPLVCEGVKELGATHIRMCVLWFQLEPNFNGKYRWDNTDRAVNAAVAAGLQILLCIEPRRSLLPGGTPSDKKAKDYGKLCSALVQRYGDRISYWEIGNEVNSLAFFGAPKKPSKYVAYLREAFTNIVALQPSAVVISAGLMGAVGTSTFTLNCVEWMKLFYAAGGQDFCHGIGLHPYFTDANFNQIDVTPDALPIKNLQGVRDVMVANGDSAKKIHITESGFETGRFTEVEQAAKLQQQQDIQQQYVDSGAVNPLVFLFDYRDWELKIDDPLKHYGVVDFNYRKKPAWFVVRSFMPAPPVLIEAALINLVAPVPEELLPLGIFRVSVTTMSVTAPVPDVQVPITPDPVEVPVVAPVPGVDTFRVVKYVSTGSGDRTTGSGQVRGVQWTHTVANVRGAHLLADIVISHDQFKAWELYDSLTITSDIDGPLLRKASRHLSATSQKNGSLHRFELFLPTPGLHTITATVTESDGFTQFSSMIGNSVLWKGSSGLSGVTSASSLSGGNTPKITVNSAVDDVVSVVLGGSGSRTAFTPGTARYSAGGTVLGDGDYMLIGDAPGALSVEMTAVGGAERWGMLGSSLTKWLPEHAVVTPPAAALSMTGPAITLS